MGRIKRYSTALSRHHRSRGFGIHSPFAFYFVRHVLREQLPYYCYEEIDNLRSAVVQSMRDVKNHPRVVAFKELKMIFRIVNYFNPQYLLQVGTNYGLTATSMLGVSSSNRMWLYEPYVESIPVLSYVLAPNIERIECYNQLDVAVDDYCGNLADGDLQFVLVNSIPNPEDYEPLKSKLDEMLTEECVIVLRNIHRIDLMKQLWEHLKSHMKYGQSFTNEKTAVLVVQKKYNVEHFFLWF